MRVTLRLLLLAAGAVPALISCNGEDLAAPSNGTIAISTTTSGPEPDPDGYTVSVNGGTEMSIGANATHQLTDLAAGSHSVLLGGLAANCTVQSDNPRRVSLEAGANAAVGFSVICAATRGTLRVTATTSGVSLDTDGYTITLDGSDRGALGANGEIGIEGLAAGEHIVGLTGISANCQASGENPRATTVTAGAVVTVAFVLTCVAPPTLTGSLRVTTNTTGESLDPDGYAFTLAGGTAQPIGTSATATVDGVLPGAHTVTLSGLASNCTVQGSNQRLATVSAGATSEVTFAVTCAAATGSFRIRTTTTGDSPDQDGYTASVDGGTAQPVDANGTLTVSGLSPGPHQVALGGLASNCSVSGSNPRSATVNAGATVEISFAVSCPAPSTAGSIEITTATTGASPDDGYTVAVDGGTAQSIGANATVTVPDVPAGSHHVTLGGIASNCTAAGENPRPISVTAGAVAAVRFDVSCPTPPSTSMIAFTSIREGFEIYVMRADGSEQRRLTNSSAINRFPVWSPDGGQILFMACADGDPVLRIMNADGSDQRRLGAAYTCDAENELPDWSPDGRQIVFVGDNYLRIINPDGTGLRKVTSDDSDYEHSPAWSPDGRRIAFVRGFNVQVINPDGGGANELTHEPTYTSPMPAWSPDSRKIAFVSHRDGNFEIYIMNADGTEQVRLTSAADTCPSQPFDCGDQQPAWSPDGRKIAFTSDRDGNDEIYIMNADGTDQTRLTNQAGKDIKPRWSRDGRKIFFISSRDGNLEIYSMNADGTEQTNLTRNSADDFDANLF